MGRRMALGPGPARLPEALTPSPVAENSGTLGFHGVLTWELVSVGSCTHSCGPCPCPSAS